MPFLSYHTPPQPFETDAVDFLKLPLTPSGNQCIFACINHISRFYILALLAKKSAQLLAQILVKTRICPSTPWTLLSDNGTEINNELLANFCIALSVVAYNHNSNGLVELQDRKVLYVIRYFFIVEAHVH